MADIRLVVTDLDGTFWHGAEVIHERTRRAYDEVRAAGIEVLIATGRRYRAVTRGTRPAGIGGSAVLMSGALGMDLDTGREWHRQGLASDDARAVLAAFRAEGVEPVAYVGSQALDAVARPDCASNPAHLASFGRHLERRAPDDLAAAGVLIGFGVVAVEDPALDRVVDRIDGAAVAWLGPDHTYGGRTLMVGPRGISKVDGVAPWAAEQGIDAREVLAVGDGSNDVELLRWAGTSVAVHGGAAERAGADHVIEGPQDGGWAELLDLL